jgi:hypothetical protein
VEQRIGRRQTRGFHISRGVLIEEAGASIGAESVRKALVGALGVDGLGSVGPFVYAADQTDGFLVLGQRFEWSEQEGRDRERDGPQHAEH